MQTRIILVRHGETDWNKERRYLSFTDIECNQTGKRQVLSAGQSIKNEKIVVVYASDLRRALNSATLLFADIAIEVSPDLREMNFGIFEGLRYEEIVARHQDIYRQWIDGPFKTTIPRGESFDAFKARVMSKIRDIVAANPGKTAAVVTHGGVIRLILWHIFKAKSFWDVKMVKPGSVTIIEAAQDFSFTVKRFEPENGVWPEK